MAGSPYPISLPLVLLPALWLMSVFHYGLEQVLIMEEKWYTLAFWFGLGAIFIIAFVLQLQNVCVEKGLFMISLSLLLVAEPMVYVGNLPCVERKPTIRQKYWNEI